MLVFATTVFIYNIHFPTLYGFAQEITAAKDYARVTSKLEIQGQFTWTIAGALGAVLLNGIEGKMNLLGWEVAVPFQFHAVPIHWIFGFDALTYLVSFVLIYRIKTIAVVDRNIDTADLLTRLKTGMNYLRKRPAIFVFGNASLFLILMYHCSKHLGESNLCE
jgi:DHA3 family macrolide efflux protein-like MFS transporter